MEIDLLTKYPKRKRDCSKRLEEKSEKIRSIARKFGWEYFDKKGICYSGYTYDGRWIPVVQDFIDYYHLNNKSRVLDVGCAKGYMIYDFVNAGIDSYGIDISSYAISSSIPEIRERLSVRNAKDISLWSDNYFDLVVCFNTIHNLEETECRKAVRELERVSKNCYLTVDSWRNEEERKRMLAWNVTGKTIMSSKDWKKLFKEEGYTGDYFWFVP